MISLGIVSRAQNYEMERTDSPMGNSTAIALACSGAGNSVQPRSGARKHQVLFHWRRALGWTYCVQKNENSDLEYVKRQCIRPFSSHLPSSFAASDFRVVHISFLWDLVSEIETPVFIGAP